MGAGSGQPAPRAVISRGAAALHSGAGDVRTRPSPAPAYVSRTCRQWQLRVSDARRHALRHIRERKLCADVHGNVH
ncbi:hypothetical protein GLE_5162 [Lysobacter enzymogenes]|uniref:Uncharacterized protein n=1 Tax=Lysobacter enzymogenes TaxID=69 RepID=A0A0S2DPA0_LYSEN|nr:hypothetical protein GLE_5162 [Lysobacter enzymogenes]